MTITILFFFCLFVIFYVYLGYPATVAVCALIAGKPVKKGVVQPTVTILIAAYNEADCIAATIENKLALDYPPEKLEIIVISDSSDDGTDEIVQDYASRGVYLIRQEPRAGKTAALNLAIPQAKGEILVFSDANSIYDRSALPYLVENFSDPAVGYVTGKMIYTNPDGSPIGDGCTAYMKYENWLRSMETRTGSLVGVDGGIDAVRKQFYKPMNSDQLPDFVLPLQVVEQRRRVVFEPRALLKEAALKGAADEYRMRVRVSLRAIWALWDLRHLLSLRQFGWFAWQLWWHKVLRYGCFFFLFGAFIANAFIVGKDAFFLVCFLLQLAGYGAAVSMPWIERRWQVWSVLKFARYFVLLNLAAAHAFTKFIRGHKQVLWTPRKG